MSKTNEESAPKRTRKTLAQKLAEARLNTEWMATELSAQRLLQQVRERDHGGARSTVTLVATGLERVAEGAQAQEEIEEL